MFVNIHFRDCTIIGTYYRKAAGFHGSRIVQSRIDGNSFPTQIPTFRAQFLGKIVGIPDFRLFVRVFEAKKSADNSAGRADLRPGHFENTENTDKQDSVRDVPKTKNTRISRPDNMKNPGNESAHFRDITCQDILLHPAFTA